MANYICRTMVEAPADCYGEVRVAAGSTLRPGQVVIAEVKDNALTGNYSVYIPGQVTDITTQEICLVLNGGFETLSDGRRPDGQPDYTKYTFAAGEVVQVIRLNRNNVKLEISKDALMANSAAVVIGGKLVPTNSADYLTFEAAGTPVTAINFLKVEAKKNFRLGGLFGGQFAETYVVRSSTNTATTVVPSV